MSKRTYISRYMLIVKRLKAKPYSSYQELQDYIESQIAYQDEDALQTGFSKRTFQRDLKDIKQLYGLDITFSVKHKGYCINEGEGENISFQRMMEAFDVFTSLNLAQEATPYLQLENRRPQGTEHLHGLLYAIQNRYRIKFQYQKFWEDIITDRATEPYALKEFKNRWYVLVKDCKDNNMKTFGLDRMTNLEITNQKFTFPRNYDVSERFLFCFGITNPEDEEPEEIILSFTPVQGKYVKTLPLHETQQILIDNKSELRLKLTLRYTHELLMELLSFGSNMKVLQPQWLADEIKEEHKKAYQLYK